MFESFFSMAPSVIWFIFAIILLILELITTALVSVWFIPGALCAALVSFFCASVGVQIAIFVMVSLVCFPISKKVYEKRLKSKEPNPLNDIVGKTGVATSTINQISGRVRIGDVHWNAVTEGENIPKNTIILVKSVSNLTATVVAVQDNKI